MLPKITQEILKKNKVKTMTWPSMLPDVNPIEDLWGIKRQAEQHNPSSKEQLKKKVSEESWNISPKNLCNTGIFHAEEE